MKESKAYNFVNLYLVKRFDASDYKKHMGLLLLSPTKKSVEDLIWTVEEVEEFKFKNKTAEYFINLMKTNGCDEIQSIRKWFIIDENLSQGSKFIIKVRINHLDKKSFR